MPKQQQQAVVKNVLTPDAKPSEIYHSFVEPLRKSWEEDNNNANLRHQLAFYLLRVEKACMQLDKETCTKESAHCIWAIKDNGFISKITRGKACRGKQLHAWQISMPPKKSDLIRIAKRQEALLQRQEITKLSRTEEEELAIMQAINAEITEETKRAQQHYETLEANRNQQVTIQKILEDCNKRQIPCSAKRTMELENRLLSLQSERVEMVGGIKEWLRRMSPYILAFVYIASMMVGITMMGSTLLPLVSQLTNAVTACLNAANIGIAGITSLASLPIAGAAMGAAMGTTVMPGVGTAAGALIGMLLQSDVKLKKKLVRLSSSKGDMCWPLPRYQWHLSKPAWDLYGLEGIETGVLSIHVRQLFPTVVQKDRNGYDHINWSKLLTALGKFRQRPGKIPRWRKINNKQQKTMAR